MAKGVDTGKGEELESIIQSTVVYFLGHIYLDLSHIENTRYLQDPQSLIQS